METTENLLNNELQIDATAHGYLAETAKWAKFLAVVGFVLSGILVLVALFAGAFLGTMGSRYGDSGGAAIGAGFATIMYLIIAVIYFFMSLFLYRFADKMKTALYASDQSTLNDSFRNLNSLYKLMGILTIIYLGFMALAIIFGIGSAAFGG